MDKLTAAQQHKRQVKCGEIPLKNTFRFKYLGSIFTADCDHKYDVKRRIALATARMGQLRHVFNANISLVVKLKL